MEHLGVEPGPAIGKALEYLMEVRLERGPVSEDDAYRLLDEWWAERDDS
jgi:poly(A) polymerase